VKTKAPKKKKKSVALWDLRTDEDARRTMLTIANVQAKIAEREPLSKSENEWLARVLQRWDDGCDLRAELYSKVAGRDSRTFSIAFEVSTRRGDGEKADAIYLDIEKRVGLKPGSVRKICQRIKMGRQSRSMSH